LLKQSSDSKKNNYEVLITISNIMKGVINDEEIEIISEFYNLDAQMLLLEANTFKNCNIENRLVLLNFVFG